MREKVKCRIIEISFWVNRLSDISLYTTAAGSCLFFSRWSAGLVTRLETEKWKERKKTPQGGTVEGADCALDVGHDIYCKSPFPVVVVVVVVVGLSLLPFAFCRRVPMSSPARKTCSLKLASACRATEDWIHWLALGGWGSKEKKWKRNCFGIPMEPLQGLGEFPFPPAPDAYLVNLASLKSRGLRSLTTGSLRGYPVASRTASRGRDWTGLSALCCW